MMRSGDVPVNRGPRRRGKPVWKTSLSGWPQCLELPRRLLVTVFRAEETASGEVTRGVGQPLPAILLCFQVCTGSAPNTVYRPQFSLSSPETPGQRTRGKVKTESRGLWCKRDPLWPCGAGGWG
ncbi:hypothetical protein SKAU_G00175990 [Synaphobranchus kaupii]|uniref:Uncharacterized protein n=1 Tax=Synaphobranchus kaupii TaxID=118154 RepID=A0A9Q1FLY0_SYNKA|nr:hypothetical protein SKAU_G00175990 [Synaphobranchus kaupii]